MLESVPQVVKTKIFMYCKYCAIFHGSIAIFFGTVSQIIPIGAKNIFANFESSILKCTILPFLKAYRPYYIFLSLVNKISVQDAMLYYYYTVKIYSKAAIPFVGLFLHLSDVLE